MVKISTKNFSWKAVIIALATLVIGIVGGSTLGITITSQNKDVEIEVKSQTIELAEEQKEAKVVNEEGVEEIVDIPTVEEVDGGRISTDMEQMSEADRSAQGFAIDISTPWTAMRDLEGKCIIMGNPFGSQCVNTTNVIAENQVGYWFSTCGSGAARGMWDCREENARGGYELITDPTQLRPGDIFVTWGGDWGHTGIVAGYYNNGYIAVFSTNQGGARCAEGGSAANIINLSMATFSGAFRWHGWDYLFEKPKEEPKPEPVIPISGCVDWSVEQGDTMIGIGIECENVVMNTEQVNNYAKTWWSQIYNKDHSVYYGWTHGTGYGLYAGDYLLHDIEGKFSE